jgi:hypothetical protein
MYLFTQLLVDSKNRLVQNLFNLNDQNLSFFGKKFWDCDVYPPIKFIIITTTITITITEVRGNSINVKQQFLTAESQLAVSVWHCWLKVLSAIRTCQGRGTDFQFTALLCKHVIWKVLDLAQKEYFTCYLPWTQFSFFSMKETHDFRTSFLRKYISILTWQ